MKKLIAIFAILLLTGFQVKPPAITWENVDDGLSLVHYVPPGHPYSEIIILRIDPAKYNFNLFNGDAEESKQPTAGQWGREHKQISVINAGMYGMNNESVGYMRNGTKTLNGHLSDWNSMLVFGAINGNNTSIQLLDLTVQEFAYWRYRYTAFIQGIRMVTCDQQNTWKQSPELWSMAAFGMDKSGNALMICSQSRFTVHDFIDILLQAPVDLYNLMYLEGGGAEGFYLNCNGFEIETNRFYGIPNVIGVTKK